MRNFSLFVCLFVCLTSLGFADVVSTPSAYNTGIGAWQVAFTGVTNADYDKLLTEDWYGLSGDDLYDAKTAYWFEKLDGISTWNSVDIGAHSAWVTPSQGSAAWITPSNELKVSGSDSWGNWEAGMWIYAIDLKRDVTSLTMTWAADNNLAAYFLGEEFTIDTDLWNDFSDDGTSTYNGLGAFTGTYQSTLTGFGNYLYILVQNTNSATEPSPTGLWLQVDRATAATPEPATFVMFGLGLCGLGLARRFGRK